MIGVVVANHLKLPRVNVCAGHNRVPRAAIESMKRNTRVSISDDCWRAVRALRERHGMPDASPFSVVDTLSPDLNVYCEPPQFLLPEEHAPFEPIVFMSSLLPDEADNAHGTPLFGSDSDHPLRIYASFGTRIWRLFSDQALGVLAALSDYVAQTREAVALVSLGGWDLKDRVLGMARPNVRVETFVDQWNVLRTASVFFTHHGLNSTHEAIYHQTPMISYPLFADQPSMAKRCQEFGLAVPLTEKRLAPVTANDVKSAIERVIANRATMAVRLAEARGWEIDAIEARPAVIDRIVDLMA